MNKLVLAIAAVLPMAVVPAAIAADLAVGKTLYVDNCMRCHGSKGQGAVGKRLAGDAAYWDFYVFKRTIMEGIDDENKRMKIMPVWGKTGFDKPKREIPTDAELQDIQAYLKTFSPAE